MSELVAERTELFQATVCAVESGFPSMPTHVVLHALGGLEKDLLMITSNDEVGRKLQDLDLPQCQRAPQQKRKDN